MAHTGYKRTSGIHSVDVCLNAPATGLTKEDVGESDNIDEIVQLLDYAHLRVLDIMLMSKHPVWDSHQSWSMFSIDALNEYLLGRNRADEDQVIPFDIPTITFRFPAAQVKSEPAVFQLLLTNASSNEGRYEFTAEPPRNYKRFLEQQNHPKPRPSSKGGAAGCLKALAESSNLLAHLWKNKLNPGEERKLLAPTLKHHPEPVGVRVTKSASSEIGLVHRTDENGETYTIVNGSRLKKGLFSIGHSSGTLQKHENRIVTFKFNYEHVGYHKMYVLLQVYPAIFIWIELTGRTLKEEQSYLQPEFKQVMNLHPISSLDLDPPIQMFWLYNGGNVATSFFIDMEPFEQLKRDNYGHSVIECLTPTGTVESKSWTAIKIRFAPLEYTEYTVLMIIIPDSSTEMSLQVPIEGTTAFNTNVCLRPKASSAGIQSFVLCDDKLPITLSPTHITINHFICTGQTVSSCVFLTNLNKENNLSFHWPETTIEGGGSISFEPDCGRIPPGGEVSCLVVIKAGSVAVTFTAAIRCVIMDEGTTAIHQFVLNKWEKEYRKSDLIDSEQPSTIVKNSRHRQRGAPKPKPTPPEPFSQLLSVSMYIGSVFGLFDAVTDRERARMPFPSSLEVNPAAFSLGEDGHTVVLSKVEREISEGVILELLWDITQGSNFETMVRQATKRQAPLYEEYKESEKMRQQKEQKGRVRDQNNVGSANPIVVDAAVKHEDVDPVVVDPDLNNEDFYPVIDPVLQYSGYDNPGVGPDIDNGDEDASPKVDDDPELKNEDINEVAVDGDRHNEDGNASPEMVDPVIKTGSESTVAVDRDLIEDEASSVIFDPDQEIKLCRRQLEEIMEASIFNLIQEMSTAYLDPQTNNKNKWFDLPPVQPQAFVDIEKYKNRL